MDWPFQLYDLKMDPVAPTIFDAQGLLHRYCELVDSYAYDRLHEVFAPDIVRELRHENRATRESRTVSTANGLEEFAGRMDREFGRATGVVSQHNVSNVRLVGPVDGGYLVRSNFYAVATRLPGEAVASMWGEYIDLLRETADGWRIGHRELVTWFTEGDWTAVLRPSTPTTGP